MDTQERIKYLNEVFEENLIMLEEPIETYEDIMEGFEDLDSDEKIDYLIELIHEFNAFRELPDVFVFHGDYNGSQCPICLGTNTYDNDNLAGCDDCNVCLTENC